LKDQTAKYNDIVADPAAPAVAELQRVRGLPEQAPTLNPAMPALDVAVAQRNALTSLLGGPTARPDTVVNNAKETMATSPKSLSPPSSRSRPTTTCSWR
jgi:hypothetical protein